MGPQEPQAVSHLVVRANDSQLLAGNVCSKASEGPHHYHHIHGGRSGGQVGAALGESSGTAVRELVATRAAGPATST